MVRIVSLCRRDRWLTDIPYNQLFWLGQILFKLSILFTKLSLFFIYRDLFAQVDSTIIRITNAANYMTGFIEIGRAHV